MSAGKQERAQAKGAVAVGAALVAPAIGAVVTGAVAAAAALALPVAALTSVVRAARGKGRTCDADASETRASGQAGGVA